MNRHRQLQLNEQHFAPPPPPPLTMDYYAYCSYLLNHPDEIGNITGGINEHIARYSRSSLITSQFRKMAKHKLSHLNRCCMLGTSPPPSIPEEDEEEEEDEDEEREDIDQEKDDGKVDIYNNCMNNSEDGYLLKRERNMVKDYFDNDCTETAEDEGDDEDIYENYKRNSFHEKVDNDTSNQYSCRLVTDESTDFCGHGVYWPDYDYLSSHVQLSHNGNIYDGDEDNGSNDSINVKSEPLYYTPGTQKKSDYPNGKKRKKKGSVNFNIPSSSSHQCKLNRTPSDPDQNWFGSGCNLWLANPNANTTNNSHDDIFLMRSEFPVSCCKDLSAFALHSNVGSLPTNDNCSHHVDHHDCGCTQHHVNSLETTPTASTPLLPSTIKTTTESLQGNHSPSPISCITPLVNTSEIHVISNSVGIQSKSNNNNSQSSVCFASSPRGNTVITHHPASPFARVPRGPILKNEINSKVSMQSVQSSAFKASITSTAVTATAITTTTIAAINTTSYSDNVSSANTSMVGLSPVQTEFSLNSSDSSSKQPFHINGSRETNVLCNESNQLRHGEDKIKSVSTQSPVNNRNNPMGSGRTRSSVCSSYPTYEEAWDLKLARQLGIGVSRLPSIIPISSTIPNYVPSLPSIPSDVTVVDRSSVILGQDNQRNVISPQSLSLYNREQLNERKSILLSNDSHSIESNLKLLNVTSSDDKLTKLTNNNSEVLINDDVNDDGDKNLVCNSKEITTGQLNRKSANGGGGSGINRLFYHNEHSHLSSHSSHMANGKTDLTENNGEYDYAYNGSWSMGVKFNLNLAINNSSNDSSVIPITPKYTNTMTTALTKTVKSNQADIQSSIHYPGSSNLFHPTSSAPPIIPSHHRQHHQLQHGLSSSQSHQSTRLNSVKNEDDFKCKPISQPVISNDLDSVSTDSCDESWDTRHGQLVSELMRGRFIDPSVIIPTTGKVTNTIPAVTTMAMNPESSCLPETNILAVPNPASSSSCTSSSLSSSSSSSSSSSTSTSSSTSHVILSSPPLPSSQCTNSVSDQFTTSSGLRYPLNKVKALSSQHNLPKGLPANLETLPLEEQLWFHPSLTRSEAEELIRNEPEGSFLVRPSETCPNDFSLTIKHKSFLHMKISRNSAGQFILGEYSQPYTSVSQMIYHYARTLVPVLGAYSVTLTHPVFKRT